MMCRLFFYLSLFPFLAFSSNIEERVKHLEVAFEKHSEKRKAAFSSPAKYQDSSLMGIHFFGEVLFWRAQSGGSETVYHYISQKLKKNSLDGGTLSKDYGTGPGFRLGAGVEIPFLMWELSSNYTCLNSLSIQNDPKFFPPILMQIRGGLFSTSHEVISDSNLTYQNIDIDLRRSVFKNRLFSLQTLLGLKTSWINIDQALTYDFQKNLGRLKIDDQCAFSGLGPQLGFDLALHLFLGFGVNASLSGGCLYGNFDVKHEEETGIGEIKLSGEKNLFSPTLNFFIGPSWTLSLKKCLFSIQLGYEAEYFWGLGQTAQLETIFDPASGPFGGTLSVARQKEDLIFYGATARAYLKF